MSYKEPATTRPHTSKHGWRPVKINLQRHDSVGAKNNIEVKRKSRVNLKSKFLKEKKLLNRMLTIHMPASGGFSEQRSSSFLHE